MGDLEEAKDAGKISRVPHFNSVLNFFDSENAEAILTDFIAKSAAPLVAVESDFAVDSSGFAGARYVQWVDEKWGTPKRKVEWVKVHAMIGVKTNVVTAAKVLEKNTADSPQFGGLVKTTAEQFTIREVSGDKAYHGRKNFAAVEAAGGQFFPAFRKDATGGVGGSYGKAFHLFSANAEEYGRHYHKRQQHRIDVLGHQAEAGRIAPVENEPGHAERDAGQDCGVQHYGRHRRDVRARNRPADGLHKYE